MSKGNILHFASKSQSAINYYFFISDNLSSQHSSCCTKMLLTSSSLNPITYSCFSSVERLLRSSDNGQLFFAPAENIHLQEVQTEDPWSYLKISLNQNPYKTKAQIKRTNIKRGQTNHLFCNTSFYKIVKENLVFSKVKMSCHQCATNAPKGFILQSAVLHKR